MPESEAYASQVAEIFKKQIVVCFEKKRKKKKLFIFIFFIFLKNLGIV